MGKSLEVSDRIAALRLKRGETQAQFAAAIGVTQQSISDWESKTGDASPSCESYVRMGNIAPYPDCLWFWQQVGLDRDAMLLAAAKVLKESGQFTEADGVAVRRLLGPRQIDSESKPIFIDAASVPIPGAVGYYLVEAAAYDSVLHVKAGSPSHRKPLYSENAGYEPIHQPGTVIILDTSSNDSIDLQPFWDKVVLLQTTLEATKIHFPPSPGLRIGRLCCAYSGQGDPTEYVPWVALLRLPDSPPLKSPYAIPPSEVGESTFGEWMLARTTDKHRLRSEHRPGIYDAELVRERAKEEFRLRKGNTILGRVIKWFRPPHKDGK